MPEMHAGRRASGGWVRRTPPRRVYGPDNLGGLCEGCGEPMPAALAGTLTHPTCDPEWPELDALGDRSERRKRAAEKLSQT